MDTPTNLSGAALAKERPRPARPVAGKACISWVTLALMTTSSVASLRASPAMAVYGLAAVFLYVVPAIIFLIPTSLVSAELASGWEGGVYRWVSEGLTKPLGFLAVWCQFAMTIFYYPSLLAYVASTFAYIINPSLAANGLYVALVIMVLFWTGVFVSSRGTKAVAGLSSAGLVVGTLVPGVVMVALAEEDRAEHDQQYARDQRADDEPGTGEATHRLRALRRDENAGPEEHHDDQRGPQATGG